MINNMNKSLGQYFTVSDTLQQIVYDWVQHKNQLLLEPSFGAGHLLQKFLDINPNYSMHCCEIDNTIKPVVHFTEAQCVTYGDFMAHDFGNQKYKTIIGNPPYVKQRNTKNLYISFIEKCYDLLDEDGELIFIVPSDFTKLTSAAPIITTMTQHGNFTDFHYPDNERLFDGASIDVVVFRYQRTNTLNPICNVNGFAQICNVNNGIITFTKPKVSSTEPQVSSTEPQVSSTKPKVSSEPDSVKIDDLFHVYVGIVSGRDEIYKVPIGNIDVLCDKNKTEKFIFINKWPSGNNAIDTHLAAHKAELLQRKIKTFNESNWYEWGAPRNMTSIQTHWNKPCIYVRTITRQTEIAFAGNAQHFGGSLLCLIPKKDNVDINAVIQYLNSDAGKKDYMYAGRYKIGHKQVREMVIEYNIPR